MIAINDLIKSHISKKSAKSGNFSSFSSILATLLSSSPHSVSLFLSRAASASELQLSESFYNSSNDSRELSKSPVNLATYLPMAPFE